MVPAISQPKQSCSKCFHVDTCVQWVKKPYRNVCFALSPSCIQCRGLSLLALAMLMLWLSVFSFAHCCHQNKARLTWPEIDFFVDWPAKHQEFEESNLL